MVLLSGGVYLQHLGLTHLRGGTHMEHGSNVLLLRSLLTVLVFKNGDSEELIFIIRINLLTNELGRLLLMGDGLVDGI